MKNNIKAFLTDTLYWLYIWGGISYLLSKWEIFNLSPLFVIIFGLVSSIVLIFTHQSIGFISYNKKDYKFLKSLFGWEIIFILILTFIIGWNVVEINLYKFFFQFKNAGGILSGLFHPNFEILSPMLNALAETIYLSLLATVFAVPFAFVLSFFAARNLMPRTFLGNTLYIIVRTIATFFRSVEALVWAIIFTVWVGIGPFAGMLALMIHSVASLTKLYSEQIENIDKGPVEAIMATGASTLQVWTYAVIPQIISPYLAFTIYRWDINVRMATIVGFVGGGGIGLALMQQQQLLRWHNVGLIIWLIALVVWIMDMISAKIRQKLLNG